MATRIARIAGQHVPVLQFHREPVPAPHLVVIRGGSARDAEMGHASRRQWRSPVLLVVVATLLAVAVDLVDTAPAWSQWAALGSLVVLVTHAFVTHLRSR